MASGFYLVPRGVLQNIRYLILKLSNIREEETLEEKRQD
jgi:hypothetical protein